MSRLVQGRIILYECLDPQGYNPKRRPFVVVTENDAIAAGEDLACVAITRIIPDPPDGHVELPWERSGNTQTLLKAKCAAVCDPPWLERVSQADIDLNRDLLGTVPTSELREIKALIGPHLT